MAEITISCPHCNASAAVDEGFVGRTVKCSRCQQRFQIAAPVVAIEEEPAVIMKPIVSSPRKTISAGAFSHALTYTFNGEGSVYLTATAPNKVRVLVTVLKQMAQKGMGQKWTTHVDPDGYYALMSGEGIEHTGQHYLDMYREQFTGEATLSISSPRQEQGGCIIFGILAVALLAALLWYGNKLNQENTTRPAQSSSPTTSVPAPSASDSPLDSAAGSDDLITLAKYDAIHIGMTKKKVNAILGQGGVEKAHSLTISIYTWSNPDGSCIAATFKYGLLASKSQVGLK